MALLITSLVADPFKVATYNVQNLFDASFDGTEYIQYIPNKNNWNKAMVETKLNHTAEVICDIDAAILGLQEIENETILKQLFSRLEEVGCGYKAWAITHQKGSAIQVALLSRYPITYQKQIEVKYQNLKMRPILEVEVKRENNSLHLFVNHWKSRGYDGVESKRIVSAQALQKRILALGEGEEYLILGDLNSDYNVYLTLEAKNNDTNGKTGFNDVLQTKIGEELVDEIQIRTAKQGVHYSLWQELALSQRWSYKFYGQKSTLDHIVLPPTLFDGRGIDYINDSFGVFKSYSLFTSRGYINRWQYKKGKHLGKGYSDHLPVFAWFDTQPYLASNLGQIKNKLPSIVTIESLYQREKVESAVILKDVVVIYQRGRNAIIKQTPNGRAIYLYGCAKNLQRGHRYDLRVEGIKNYNGLKEISDAYQIKERKKVINIEAYSHHIFSVDLPQNEILREIKGVYREGFFSFQGQKLPILFKKKKMTPPNGSTLKIDYAHLGYDKQLQLVVYSPKDFTVLE